MTETNENIKALWDLQDYSASKKIQEAAYQLRLWLTLQIDDKIALFLAGHGDPIPDSPDTPILTDIESEIIKHYRPFSQAVIYLMAFAVVVNRGNKVGLFNICPPRVPVHHIPPKSPFSTDKFSFLKKNRIWREKIINTYTPSPANNLKLFIGQILASAIINGGIIDHKILSTLFLQLHQPLELIKLKKITSNSASRSYLDLAIPRAGGATPELRRWFPDYFTEVLLYRLPTKDIEELQNRFKGPKRLSQKLYECIEKFFIFTSMPKDELPNSITTMFTATLFEMQTKLPMFLCQYAAGREVSHSLREDVWKRFHNLAVQGKKKIQIEKEETEKAHPPQPDSSSEDIKENIEEDTFDTDWLKDLRQALKLPTRQQIRKKVDTLYLKHLNKPLSIPAVFIGWVLYMLSSSGSSTRKTEPLSKIQANAGNITNRIISYLGSQDISTLEEEGLEEIYHQILEDTNSYDRRQKVARGLRDFHLYMVDKLYASPINHNKVLGIGPLHSKVDANIITYDEYFDILAHLELQNLETIHPDFAKVVTLIFTLSFRCGLRRSEALKLLIEDFHDSDQPVLLIRNNFARRLKTKNAVRKLPLDALLSDTELEQLRNWALYRLKQENENSTSPFLFSIPDLKYTVIPELKIFTIIHNSMRKVTKDATLSFYNLRHSFASWTLLRLTIADLNIAEDIVPHLPETTKHLQQAAIFRDTLFRKKGSSRRYLFAISSMMGHSSPKTTIEHYLHFMGLLLNIFQKYTNQYYTRTSLIKNSELPKSSTQRWYNNGGADEFMVRLRSKQPANRLQLNRQTEFPNFLDIEKIQPEADKIHRVWMFLFLRSARGMSVELLEDRLMLSRQETNSLEFLAGRIQQNKPRSGIGHRHRMLEKVVTSIKHRENDEENTRLLCPPWPRIREQQRILNKYTPRVWSLLDQEHEFMTKILIYFIKNSWYTRNEVIFHNFNQAKDAINYIIFLKKIGINKNQLRIVSFDINENSTHRAEWKKLLNLDWRIKIHYAEPRNKESFAVKKWLGIQPLFPSGKNKEPKSSSGYRFMMVMTAICATYNSSPPDKR